MSQGASAGFTDVCTTCTHTQRPVLGLTLAILKSLMIFSQRGPASLFCPAVHRELVDLVQMKGSYTLKVLHSLWFPGLPTPSPPKDNFMGG